MSIQHCRLCGSSDLASVVNLGNQAFTGIFPPTQHQARSLESGPLELLLCLKCSLLQLASDFNRSLLYGDTYGYRSGLNKSMVEHLKTKYDYISRLTSLVDDDVVLDIGSNDGTLLGFFPDNLTRIGIDPSCSKYAQFYKAGIITSSTFFDEDAYKAIASKKAKVITSISMFYDLPDPLQFALDVKSCLDDNGIWLFEQSYLPSMLRTNSYDTICHEHVEYYSLQSVKYILDKASFRIIDVSFNNINGGSFSIVATHSHSDLVSRSCLVEWLLKSENDLALHSPSPYRKFEERIFRHRDRLMSMIDTIKRSSLSIYGLGASTKGNVLLQFCGLTHSHIAGIGDVNPDKFNCFTPGSCVPILPEEDVMLRNPDFIIILPWHFRSTFDHKLANYISSGGKVIYPLPEIELI